MRFSRTEILIGKEGVERLARAKVAVFGLGGVGGYAVEAFARAGIGTIRLVDCDVVELSNLNRQILAVEGTLGMPKVDVAACRILEINPAANVEAVRETITRENAAGLIPADLEYAVDAIDSVDAKVHLIVALIKKDVRFVSCMGAGSRLRPTAIKIDDISRTKYCPLARVVRQRLRKFGVHEGVRCIYSEENLNPAVEAEPSPEHLDAKPVRKRRIQGSISFIPGIIGLAAAGAIINDILSTPT